VEVVLFPRNINGAWFNIYQITAEDPRLFVDMDEFCPDHSPVTFHIVVFKDKQTKTAQAFFGKESSGDRGPVHRLSCSSATLSCQVALPERLGISLYSALAV
jgi:hypothetical protein